MPEPAVQQQIGSNGLPAEQNRPGRASEVLTELRRLIDSGSYPPGTKLPPERVLAAQLGVGRPALREAIKALSILDVLESRRGDGTYVRSADALQIGWPTRVRLRSENIGMLELLELRKIIEPKAAAMAAARASEAHLREIAGAQQSLDNEEDRQRVAELDWVLHSAIIRAAQNSALDYMNEMLKPLMLKSRSITSRSAPNLSRMRSEHRAIVEAILRAEPEQAEKAMLEHLHWVGIDLITEIRS